MLGEVKGLVLRVTNVGESDRLLTIYTEESGIVTAMAKGSRKLKSNTMSATLQFCYSSFILYSKSDKYWIREATLHESFYGIRNSIEGLALAGYIVDVLSEVSSLRTLLSILFLAFSGSRLPRSDI